VSPVETNKHLSNVSYFQIHFQLLTWNCPIEGVLGRLLLTTSVRSCSRDVFIYLHLLWWRGWVHCSRCFWSGWWL